MDYKKILEGVVYIINTTEKSDIGFSNICSCIDKNCPELKESEDETIRKSIIGFLKTIASLKNGRTVSNEDFDTKELLNWATWLEKQGKNNMGISEATKQELKDNLNKALEQETAESWNEFLDEQKPADIERLLQAEYKKGWDKALLQLPKEVDSQIWQIANNSAKTWEQSFAILCATQKAYDKGRKDALREQNPADKVKPKFHEGEWVIDYQGIVHQIANVVENVTNHTHGYDTVDGGYFNDNTEGVRLWTIQDAKDGDVLVASDDSIFIFAGVADCACKYYAALTKFNQVKINKKAEGSYWETSIAVHPATKEQRYKLEKAMADSGYTFDFKKKELKKIEQNPINNQFTPEQASVLDKHIDKLVEQKHAWSGEDKETFGYLEDLVDFCYCNQYVVNVQTCERVRQLVFRLKSLYFQSEWSKDDIIRINEIIESLNIIQANRVRTQRMHYNKATIDKDIDFLKTLKDRVGCEVDCTTTKEWSEEDKKKLSRIYSILGQAADEHAFSNTCRLIGDKECVELQDWLKTLEDRYCSSAQT